MIRRKLAILAVLFLMLTAAIPAQTAVQTPAPAIPPPPTAKLPPLTHVFSQSRSETEDIILFRNGDQLKGTVQNQTLTVTTPYGACAVPLRKCAGISFEGSRANTEALVTVNYNRMTGLIQDPAIKIQIGTSGAPIEVRKEKIKFVLLKRVADETDFVKSDAKTNLFVMANGDLLTGQSTEAGLKIKTDYAEVPVQFSEIKTVAMQGEQNVTAVIGKKNGDTMRGTLETEELTLKLDAGLEVAKVYKDKFSKVFVDNGNAQVAANFGGAAPVRGESEGAAFNPPAEAGAGGDVITNSIGMKLKLIPAGSFMMGSPDSEEGRRDSEGPPHKVTLTKSFYMGVYEVTQEQYEKVMGANPSSAKGAKLPVETVEWDMARDFCLKLSQKEKNLSYRLPTEAEWEYAARAGTKTAYYWGEDFDGRYAWSGQNSGRKTHEVGTRQANPWGLYDMSGNVWEWCEDWYADKSTSSEEVDPKIGPNAGWMVKRGGSWYDAPRSCRSADRGTYSLNARTYGFIGFRVLAVPNPNAPRVGNVSVDAPGAGGGGAGSGMDRMGQTYFMTVLKMLEENFKPPHASPGVICRVGFTIMKDGSIINPRIVKSTNNPSLDQSAVQAVLKTERVPPLYDGIRENMITVIVNFDYGFR